MNPPLLIVVRVLRSLTSSMEEPNPSPVCSVAIDDRWLSTSLLQKDRKSDAFRSVPPSLSWSQDVVSQAAKNSIPIKGLCAALVPFILSPGYAFHNHS